MNSKLTPTRIIVLGIVVFLIGCIPVAKYDKAKESGYEVDATIVEVKTKTEHDMDGGPDSTSYTVYADYEIDGKEYKHVRVGKYYDTDEYYVGKTIKVVVNPNSPGKPMYEGGVLCVVGFLMVVGGVIVKIISKREEAAVKDNK